MAKPYSSDLCERVVKAVMQDGMSRRAAAQRFGIGVSTVITWMQHWRDTGHVKPGQMGGHRPKKIAATWRTWLLQRCRDRAFTLRGRVGELAERGLKVDYRVVWAFVHAENLTHKKTLLASEQDRADVVRRRAQWLKHRGGVDPKRLGFVDETWLKTNMAPLRGWAPRGQRLKAKVPHRRWKTMSFIAALRHDRVDAPWLIDGPVNGERFRLYVEQVLAPTLHSDDIVCKSRNLI